MTEEIGKHKGAVETLLHEKKELSRLLQIVNSQLERHLSALSNQGVDTDKFVQKIQQQGKERQEERQKQSQKGKESRKNPKTSQSHSENSRSQENSRSRKNSRRQQGSNNKEEKMKDVLEDEEEENDRDFNPL